jgi:hypothetical protein
MRTRLALLLSVVILITLVPLGTAAQVTDPGGTFIDDNGNPHEPNIEAIAALLSTTATARPARSPEPRWRPF